MFATYYSAALWEFEHWLRAEVPLALGGKFEVVRTETKTRSIASVRIGHLVFFEVEMVRTYLAERRLARGRYDQPRSLLEYRMGNSRLATLRTGAMCSALVAAWFIGGAA